MKAVRMHTPEIGLGKNVSLDRALFFRRAEAEENSLEEMELLFCGDCYRHTGSTGRCPLSPRPDLSSAGRAELNTKE